MRGTNTASPFLQDSCGSDICPEVREWRISFWYYVLIKNLKLIFKILNNMKSVVDRVFTQRWAVSTESECKWAWFIADAFARTDYSNLLNYNIFFLFFIAWLFDKVTKTCVCRRSQNAEILRGSSRAPPSPKLFYTAEVFDCIFFLSPHKNMICFNKIKRLSPI